MTASQAAQKISEDIMSAQKKISGLPRVAGPIAVGRATDETDEVGLDLLKDHFAARREMSTDLEIYGGPHGILRCSSVCEGSLRPCQVHEADRFLPKGEMSTDLEIFGGLMVRPLRCSTLMLELMPFERHLPGFGSAV
ncbi:unnamed protein product [Durusdinium trenchii]|uniref:Uncharacterized protein n=2 Tax=Durusdinium trenchii TaxID=1381693 RepID=A0ABP0KAI6_9DINO